MSLLGFIGGLLGLTGGGARRAIDIQKSAAAEGLPIIFGRRKVENIPVFKTVSRNNVPVSVSNYSAIYNPVPGHSHEEVRDNTDWLFRIDVWGQGPIHAIERFWIDGESHTASRFNGEPYFRAISYYGSDNQTAYTDLAQASNRWTSAHRGRGVAYSANRFYNAKKKPQFTSEPKVEALVAGLRCYDPRLDSTVPGGTGAHRHDNPATWSFTQNRILAALRYLMATYGQNAPIEEIHLPSWMAAADKCDVNMTIPATLTNTTGTTITNWWHRRGGYFVDLEPDDPFPDYRPDQTGTTQPRYQANAVLDPKKSIPENMKILLEGFNAIITWSNGQYKILIEDIVAAPVMFFDDDSIIGNWDIKAGDRSKRLNRMTIEFVNANKDYQDDTVSWPALDSTTYADFLAEDQGEALHTNIKVESITDFYQAQAYAELLVRDSRVALRVAVDLAPKALLLEPGDVIGLTNLDKAFNGTWFRVNKTTITANLDVRTELSLYDPTVHGAPALDQEPLNTTTDVPNPWLEPPAVTDLDAVAVHSVKNDGSVISGFDISWTAPINTAGLDYIEAAWAESPATTFSQSMRVDLEATTARCMGLVDGIDYDIQVTYRTALGQISGAAVVTRTLPAAASRFDAFEDGATRNVHRGAYSAATAYYRGDIVTLSGSSYTLVVAGPVTGNAPPSANWETFAAVGAQGVAGVDGADALGSIPLSFSPGRVGGSGDFVFTLDMITGGSVNLGEIRVQGSRFLHPDGVERTFADDKTIATAYGEGVAGRAYLMWTDTAVSTRFSGYFTETSHCQNIAVVRPIGSAWKAVDNSNTEFALTIQATDCLLAVIEAQATTGGLTAITPFVSGAAGLDGAPGVDGADGAPGADGADGLNVARVSIYKRSATTPALPSALTTYTFATDALTGLTNGWTQSVPAGSSPLYVALASAVSSGASDTIAAGEWTSPVILAQDGATGSAGINSATVFLYQRAASTPSLPSVSTTYTFATRVLTGQNNGWAQTIPAGSDPLYVTTATAASNTATDTIASGEWAAAQIMAQNGATGPAGTNNATVLIFKRSATAPTLPSATTTYTFATAALTGLNNGWTTSVPAGSDPLYVSAATASSATATDTIAAGEWASAQILAQDGAAGLNSASVYLYKRSATAPALPSASTTYTFATGVLTGITNGWTQSVPAGSNPLYVTTATAISAAATDTIASGEWAGAQVLTQNGVDGATGPQGPQGEQGTDAFQVVGRAGQRWGFQGGSAQGWTLGDGTLSAGNDSIILTGDAGTNMRFVSPAISISGASNYAIRIKIRATNGDVTDSPILYYATAGHTYSNDYYKALPTMTFRDDEYIVLIYDMRELTDGGNDWVTNTITGIRLDPCTQANKTFEVDGVVIGYFGSADITEENTALNVSNVGAETVATAQDAINRALSVIGGSNQLLTTTILDGTGTTLGSVHGWATRASLGLDSSGDLQRNVPTGRITSAGVTQHQGAINALALLNGPAQAGATAGATWGANITDQPAAYALLNRFAAHALFRDTFDSDDIAAAWETISGAGEVARVAVSDASGGYVLRLGNNSGNDEVRIAGKQLIPYDPTRLYEIAFRLRRTVGTGTVYLGFLGVAADGVTLVNASGANNSGSQFYFAASNYAPGSSFTIKAGYAKALSGSASTGPFNSPASPGAAHTDVRYLRPFIIANNAGQTGVTELDLVQVREVNLGQELLDGRVATALNSSGRVASFDRLPGIIAGGYGATFNVVPITGWTDMTGSTRINIQASILRKGSTTTSYPAGSISGLQYSTKYYIYRDDPDQNGGGTYTATTSFDTASAGENRASFGWYITGSSGGSGGGGSGGGEQCVALDMWLAPGLVAFDAQAGDDVWIMADADRTRAWQGPIVDVHGHFLAECVDLFAATGGCVTVSADTPVTTEDGTSWPAAMMAGRRIACITDGAFGWTDCIDVRPAGVRWVARISVGGHCYFAGHDPHNLIGTHNAEKP